MAVLISKQIKVLSAGKRASDYAVGDSVFLPVNGTNTEFIVVHQGNPDSSIYSTTFNGCTWLMMKDAFGSTVSATSGNNNYSVSPIDSTANVTFYNALSAAAQGAIQEVKIPYRPGTGTSKTCNTLENGLARKCFVLSIAEVGLESASSYAPTNEGAKLSYFTEGDGTDACNKRKLSNYQWTRSPYCSGSNGRFYSINSEGKHYSSSSPALVRPVLVIGGNTKFDPNTNVIMG